MNSTFTKFTHALMVIMLFMASASFAQKLRGTVKGYIFTADNKPADNVSVALRGTSYGTITNTDGYFELKAPEGSYQITLTHVGVQPKTYNVQIYSGQTVTLPNTVINADNASLREVSVSGSKINKFKFKRSETVAKMPLDNLENPQVYSTIGADLMIEQSAFTVDDAVKNAPGLQTMWNATGRGGDGGSYYNSRGFILQSQLRNGVAGNVTNTIDGVNIDRIEVIKGPSATLFGSTLTSYGGLINRVTKKPYDTFGGSVSVTAGNLDYKRASFDVNTPLNASKTLLFRLNGAYTYQEGTQDNYFNRSGAIAPVFLYKVNDRLSIQAEAELLYGKNSAQAYFFFPYGVNVSALGATTPEGLGIDIHKSYFDRSLAQNTRNTNFVGTVNYKISNSFTSQTVVTTTQSYSNGFNPYFYLSPGKIIGRYDQSTLNSISNNTEVQENINGDFRIGELRNRLLIGLDYFHVNSKQMYLEGFFDNAPLNNTFNYSNFNYANFGSVYAGGATPTNSYPYYYKTSTYSAYVSDVLNLTDQLSALAALRVDNFHNNGSQNPFTGAISGNYNQTALSPKFGLVFQPVKDQVSLFANYQNGFTNVTGTTFDGKTFKPQQANQVEGGVKLDIFNGKLSTTLSYYSINVTNLVRADVAHPNFSIQNGTQLSKGFEAEVIANPFAGFNLTGGFAYNDSKLTAADADVEGRRPSTAMSPYSANLWVSYRLQDPVLKGLGVGFGLNYASENHIVNSVSQGVFSLPAYTILRGSLFYDQPKYRLGLTVNNLTDKAYYIGYTTINPQNLRQFLATATFKF
ncbi:TonB-dependent receptor [Mucilaginibacter ginkgonis]|uniref:TonB-dependent receptor n=1 Tax=Mucilaginibacter ginkgonis TaxID=2682091 RepID=A0A7T7JH11_9SPHI|nr:TonB-dependent receptor [Mucilaginibacter ginkgonis]QQL49734.1 TonB-dependent receptor [Mucilaginibacter ginkgonis]